MRSAVPAADSADNLGIADVVGNKDDTHAGTSLMSHAESIDEHVHTQSLTHPTLADGELVESDGVAWTLGAFKEIAAVNAIATDFGIHWVSVEALTANDVYELWLYAVEVFIGRVRFTKNANLDATMNVPFQCAIIAANTQIQAKLASGTGGSDARISLFYHVYA